MTLTDRYLKAVAAQLPRATRDDIIAELRDAIQTRMEDREESLGRPLTEAEKEAVLREVGHPLTVAARYGSGPQHVVGPELYPWWMFGVKVALVAMAAITVIGLVVRVFAGDMMAGQAIGHAFANVFNGAITIVGLATLAAFIIERQKEKPAFIRDWRVKDLGLFEIAAFDADSVSRALSENGPTQSGAADRARGRVRGVSGQMSPAARGVASAIAWAVFLLWWTGLLTTRDLRPIDLAVTIDGVSYSQLVIQTLGLIYWPVIAYAVARIVFGLARAAMPGSVRLTGLGDLALSVTRACFYGWLWMASPLSPLIRADSLQTLIERVATMVQTHDWALATIIMLVVAIGFVTSVFEASGALWRLVTGKPSPGADRLKPSLV
ncbi:hypothetical protein KOAAANKH_00202 [Brevundimonas sp. NIBR10]|uniref:HAAS signaling domain-containing protein n=1 Tax=Brevundimonas sp. NIBR10 TaxID=3015997 RepID=UPI0022F16A88|nr:hypothetical protein [Brevundimonas sp. NIBR10]WGM45340.1 hypothetical protein KOAAANKH_00202 [Brevundimonas sp. NIBR10]